MNRRRSPGYVRQMPSQGLHALATRLQRDFMADALTPAQDWLLGCCVSELEYRRRAMLRDDMRLLACSCYLCLPLDEWSADERQEQPVRWPIFADQP